MERYKTSHHILPKSKNWSDKEPNRILIDDWVHKCFHIIFANKTIKEQILFLLKLNNKVLIKEFKEKILDILESDDPRDYYRDEAFKHMKNRRKVK